MDWTKLVDGGPFESSITHSAAGAAGSTQKRKPGRRGRKPMAAIVEATADESQDVPTDFTWWRGGLISKFIFQKGTLPRRMVKKAALEGVFEIPPLPFLYCRSSIFHLLKRRNIPLHLTIISVEHKYKCHEITLNSLFSCRWCKKDTWYLLC